VAAVEQVVIAIALIQKLLVAVDQAKLHLQWDQVLILLLSVLAVPLVMQAAAIAVQA
tara:strand:+ start:96 stop:266 length:171 start_codon:yes stop_codon:yes gene_type:complete